MTEYIDKIEPYQINFDLDCENPLKGLLPTIKKTKAPCEMCCKLTNYRIPGLAVRKHHNGIGFWFIHYTPMCPDCWKKIQLSYKVTKGGNWK